MSSNTKIAIVETSDGSLRKQEVPGHLKAGDDHYLPVEGQEGVFTKVTILSIVGGNASEPEQQKAATSGDGISLVSIQSWFSGVKWRWYHWVLVVLVLWFIAGRFFANDKGKPLPSNNAPVYQQQTR